jgi:hypothetical protein
MEVIKQFGKGLRKLVFWVGWCVVVATISCAPFYVAVEYHNKLWLLCYIPHFLLTIFIAGEEV